MVHRSEAEIKLDMNKSNNKPILRTVKDTIQITNRRNDKPLTPTINETVFLDKPSIRLSNKKSKEVDRHKLIKSVEDQTFDRNTKVTETRLFIEKKKKERSDKHIIDLLEKKKLIEERKKKLDQLKKTTRELAKASVKPKIICIQDECKISTKIPTVSNEPEVNQTWSPPQEVKNLKKKLTTPINLRKGCEIIFNEDKCLSVTKNMDNKSTTNISSKISKNTNTISQTSLIDKKPQVCKVTKPEHLFSKLNFNDNYEQIDRNIFNISKPKIVNIDTSLQHKDDNCVKLTDICDNEKTQEDICLNKEMFEININTNLVNTETQNGVQLPICSHGEIMRSINHLAERQELLIDQCLLSKNCYSESTQTDDYNSLLSMFSSKECPPPMNFMSVLKCKYNLQQSEKNYLKSQKSNINLDKNEYSISNKLHINNIDNTNNVESTVHNIPDRVDCDNIVRSLNLNQSQHEYDSNKSIHSLINTNLISDLNNLSLNQLTQNNICEDQTNRVTNDKSFTHLNILTNEDIKQVLKKNNHDFDDLLTKNSSNDEMLKSSSCCFPEIYNEFQAELNTLDQLNNSLDDIEKMGCDNTSFKANELSIDDEFNDCTNDLNVQKMFNILYSDNNGKQSSFSKLNSVSSNMMSMDKTIIEFSIQLFEQRIKDQEILANQHQTLLCLREKSLMNCLMWEDTIYNIQLKHCELQPMQLQLIKQKQRGRVKKLEQSLFRVKQLARTINSLYKQHLIILNEHLQHLTQSNLLPNRLFINKKI